MTVRKRNIMVGLVVLGALLALAWMILQFSSNSVATLFSKTTPITISVDRADGLAEGSGVQYLGVTVGRVLGVRRMPDNRSVEVDAVLNEGEELPSNVEGFIKPLGALGSAAIISLEVKSDPTTRKPQDPSGTKIKARDRLTGMNRNQGLVPPEFTEIARSIQEQKLIAHLDETVREMRTQFQKAGESLAAFNGLVGDPKLKEDLKATLASIRATAEDLQKFGKRLDGLGTEAEATLKQARTTLASGGKQIDDTGKQLNDRLAQIGELTDKFNAIAGRIEKGKGTLGLLVNDSKLYEGLVDNSKALNLTIADLRRLVEQWEQEGFTLKLK